MRREFRSEQESLNDKNSTDNRFSIKISMLFFVLCLLVSLIGAFVPDVLDVSSVIYPFYLLLSTCLVVFVIFTSKKRNIIDFIITGLIFFSVLSISVQCIAFFYRARTGEFYYSLSYRFPGILEFKTNTLISQIGLRYKITKIVFLFDPTFIVSLVCLAIAIFSNVSHKSKVQKAS